jgi:hypothetical protein
MTGRTHREVNGRINRAAGVTTRSGANNQVLYRAVDAARVWLHQIARSTAPPPAR